MLSETKTHKSGMSVTVTHDEHSVLVAIYSPNGECPFQYRMPDAETAWRWARLTIKWVLLTDQWLTESLEHATDGERMDSARRIKQQCTERMKGSI